MYAAQVLGAAVAEDCRPLGATVARRHCLVETPETARLDLFAGLGLQTLVGSVLRGWCSGGGWVMLRVRMSGRGWGRICMMRTCLMFWMCMRVALWLRLGLHVESTKEKFSVGHSLFLTRTPRAQ